MQKNRSQQTICWPISKNGATIHIGTDIYLYMVLYYDWPI